MTVYVLHDDIRIIDVHRTLERAMDHGMLLSIQNGNPEAKWFRYDWKDGEEWGMFNGNYQITKIKSSL